ncbi:MAG: SDR family oxidoreductase [Bacteroidia bacterium]|nr:SDR family oxidoreductase [Bacteroidia bacterium]
MFQSDIFLGKKVLVTGGGSGIGYGIAKLLLELGAEVVIASRKEDRLKAAQKELSQYGKCHIIVLDIRELVEVEKVILEIQSLWGGLDILINNAGGQFPSPAENIAPKGWLAVINNNLNGLWWVTSTAAKTFFIPQKSGIIINIIANIFRGFPGMAHTGAARAGVDNLTKSLAVEWVTHNIRINAIAPGVIQSSGLDQYPPELLQSINTTIPMKRTGSVEDVAWLTAFLASPMGNYITGETIYVDGGQRLWGNLWQIPDPT